MRSVNYFLVLLVLAGCQSYKMDGGKWSFIRYDEGVGRNVMAVEGADQASFKQINREYAKDLSHVYWEQRVIPGADPETFTSVGLLYSKDKQRVFWREREITGAEPASFRVVDGRNLLSKDKNDFYFGENRLGVLDMTSFHAINPGWAKDAKAYYATPNFWHSGRVDCDYATMKILSEDYAVDKDRAYYWGRPIKGADPETFRVNRIGQSDAQDKFRKYSGGGKDWLK